MTSFPYKFTTFCLNIYITGFCCYHHLSCHPQPNHVWGILVWWTAFCFLSWCLVKFLLSDEKTFSFSSASYSVVKSAKKLTIEVQLSQRIARFVQYPNQWELLVYVSSTDFIFQVDFYLCNSQICNYNSSFPSTDRLVFHVKNFNYQLLMTHQHPLLMANGNSLQFQSSKLIFRFVFGLFFSHELPKS